MNKVNILFLIFLSGVACRHPAEKENFIGKEIGVASKEFSITEPFAVNSPDINLKTSQAYFSGAFNERVSFTITLKGQTSGAIKRIKGLSDKIDISNSSWEGNAELTFFMKEKVSAYLSVLGINTILDSTSFNITEPYLPGGTIVANMENSGIFAPCGFFQPGGQIFCGRTKEIPAIEGEFSQKMEGKDPSGGMFIGLTRPIPVPGKNADVSGLYYNVIPNPDSVWFTIFIYGTGDPSVQAYIKFQQDDNGDGVHSDNQENGFEIQIQDLSHFGWKKFSFLYSTLTVSGNTSYGGNGDQEHRPHRITAVEIALWGMVRDKTVKYYFDFPVFTVGKPF